jgi:CBS domain-containing protein
MRLIIDSRGASSVGYAMILGFIVSASAIVIAGVGARSRGVFARLGTSGELTSDAGRHELAATSDFATLAADSAGNDVARTIGLSVVLAIGSGLAAFVWGKQLGRKMHKTKQADLGGHEHEAMPASLQLRIFAKRQLIYGILDSNEQLMSANHLQVRHVMTRDDLATVPPDATADEVARRMRDLRVRHLLVFEETKLAGVISDRDLHTRSAETAREIMTRNPVTVPPATPVARAVTMLMEHGFSCLPVVEGSKVCGLLTSTDLMMTLQCQLRLMDEIAIQLNRDPGELAA